MKVCKLLVMSCCLFVAVNAGQVSARSASYTKSKTSSKQRLGRWTVSQKAAARRAINALEELDKWIKYYPSRSMDEFQQRSDDTAYIVNQSVAVLPSGTMSTKLKKAADGFRAIVLIAQLTDGLPQSDSTDSIAKQTADVLRRTRQNIQEAKFELSKR